MKKRAFNSEHPFDLPLLPPDLDFDNHPNSALFKLYMEAQQNISELNGMLEDNANLELLLIIFYLQESIYSSAIENINTTIESALEDETKPKKERSYANKEISNYREAIDIGHKNMEKYGLSSRTIKSIHSELKMKQGVSGEYRTSQNQIVNTTGGTQDVIYTPPKCNQLNSLLSNWEQFVHDNKSLPPLVKVAICHYQFEAIHPFYDGNGRTGRILMVLQLVLENLSKYPALFISGYLNENQDKYKKLLLNISTKEEWWEFVEFMLIGFSTQAQRTKSTISHLRSERENLKNILRKNSFKIKKTNITHVVNHIFLYPATHPGFMEKKLEINRQTCSKYLKALTEAGVLEAKKKGRYKFYCNIAFYKIINFYNTKKP